jgi:Mrp family chromosome partitioning ATPase
MLSIRQFDQSSSEAAGDAEPSPEAPAPRELPPEAAADEPAPTRKVPVRRGSDEYDALLWRIKPAVDQAAGGAFRLGVLANRRRSGASTVAANLAIRAADLGWGPVLLVDANLAAPRVKREFRLPAGPGLVEACVESLALSSVVRGSGVEGLEVLPAGKVRLLKRAGLSPSGLQGLLHEMTEAYEFVVFDLPAADRLGPALPIAQALDAALLVLRSEKVSETDARRAARRLAVDGIPLSGAVLSRQRQYVPHWLRRWL